MDDSDRAWYIAVVGAIAVCLIAVGVFWYLKTNTYTETGLVTALTWQRDLNVNVFKQLEDTSVKGFQPADAYDLAEYTRTWTTYTHFCSGTGKNETCYDMPQFHTEYRYRYHINRWVYDHTLRTTGTPHDERLWPAFTPDVTEALGAQREGGRLETFYVAFKTNDGKLFTYATNDINDWRKYSIERHYKFQVNRLEEPQWTTLAAT